MLADGGKENWSGGERTGVDGLESVREKVWGSEASQTCVTGSPISSGQLGTNGGDSYSHIHTHNTYKCNLLSCGHGDSWLLLASHTLC